jgi:hypothetical protein
MMEVDQDHVSDESCGKPESRFHEPFEAGRHISAILQAKSMDIFFSANQIQAWS